MKHERDIPFPVKRFARNLKGRDFIVADLHGCRTLFMKKLEQAGFDPSRDRVFSVGDLVDRGPESFETLKLIQEPWFHYVPGNHEGMLLTYLNVRDSEYHSGRDFIPNGGTWITTLTVEQRAFLRAVLVPLLVNAPLVMEVDDALCPFNVLHAEALARRGHLLTNADFKAEDDIASIEAGLTWGRRLVAQANKAIHENTVVASNGVMIAEPAMHPGLALTYVGHTILEQEILHKSHLFIDRGGYLLEQGNEAANLSVLNHHDVVRSLRAAGVAL